MKLTKEQEEQKEDLEKRLKNIKYYSGRIRFIQRNKIFPEVKIALYEQEGEFDKARRVAEKSGMNKEILDDLYEKTIQSCEKAGLYLYGARIARKAGLTEKSNSLYIEECYSLEKFGMYDRVLKIAKESGLKEYIMIFDARKRSYY
jgi:hypothetical protein